MVKWSKLSKARVFRGQEKKIDTKILHHPGLYPQFFLPAAPFFIFCSAKKGSLETKFLHRTQTFLPAAPFILFLNLKLRKKRSANASPFIGGSTGSTGYRTPESTSLACTRLPRGSVCAGTKSLPHPNNIPNVFGDPLAFCSQNATRPKLQKVLRACSAPGFGTPF